MPRWESPGPAGGGIATQRWEGQLTAPFSLQAETHPHTVVTGGSGLGVAARQYGGSVHQPPPRNTREFQATPLTFPECPVRVRIGLPVRASQILSRASLCSPRKPGIDRSDSR